MLHSTLRLDNLDVTNREYEFRDNEIVIDIHFSKFSIEKRRRTRIDSFRFYFGQITLNESGEIRFSQQTFSYAKGVD